MRKGTERNEAGNARAEGGSDTRRRDAHANANGDVRAIDHAHVSLLALKLFLTLSIYTTSLVAATAMVPMIR